MNGAPSSSLSRTASVLPIDDALPAILAAFKAQNTLVIHAPPGAGKTTVVPAALLDHCTGQILLIEPRRVAARNAAAALAERLGVQLGQRVGYAVRGDSQLSKATRLKVVTPGVFLAMLQADPTLAGIDAVILDEFHERQRDIDLAFALTRDAQSGLREDLRLLVMSATLDQAELAAALPEAAFITSEGRQFPLTIRYADLTPAEAVAQLIATEPGDLLLFLPGRREIDRLAEQLAALARRENLCVTRLHGGLSLAEQRAAIAPSAQRRVILATNIAESSLTVPGVRLVIDSGWERRVEFDLARGVDALVTRPISRASATQRAGRAGRLEAGLALRLWREAAHGARPEQSAPEITRSDLAGLVLQCAQWGAPAEQLPFLTPPPAAALARARSYLGTEGLGLIDCDGRPTVMGQRCAALPLAPAEALLVLFGQARLAAALADGLTDSQRPDLAPWLDRLPDSSRQLARRLALASPAEQLPAAAALARAFPHWLAQRQNRKERDRIVFATAGGGQVLLEPGGALDSADYLAVGALQASEKLPLPIIAAALPLSLADIRPLFADCIWQENRVAWSQRSEALEARIETRLGALRLEHRNQSLADLPTEQRAEAVLSALHRLGPKGFLSDAARQWLARLDWAEKVYGDAAQPDRPAPPDWQNLDWLLPYLGRVTNKDGFRQVDWLQALQALVPFAQRRWLDTQFPERLPLPSGRFASVDYCADPPRLAGKLQEFFGSRNSPSVAQGRLPLVLDLLSPGGHSLAVTRDLPAFWAGAYRDVAKEGRARYAKHPWPEDPTSAAATAATNRRLRQGEAG